MEELSGTTIDSRNISLFFYYKFQRKGIRRVHFITWWINCIVIKKERKKHRSNILNS